MLNALADLIVTIFQALVDVTLAVCRLALRPFRFLFSRSYRQEMRQGWRLHPVRAWFEFIGGGVVLLLLVAMISFWTFVFVIGAREPAPAEQKEATELKQRIIEKIRRQKKKGSNTSTQSLESTATRRVASL